MCSYSNYYVRFREIQLPYLLSTLNQQVKHLHRNRDNPSQKQRADKRSVKIMRRVEKNTSMCFVLTFWASGMHYRPNISSSPCGSAAPIPEKNAFDARPGRRRARGSRAAAGGGFLLVFRLRLRRTGYGTHPPQPPGSLPDDWMTPPEVTTGDSSRGLASPPRSEFHIVRRIIVPSLAPTGSQLNQRRRRLAPSRPS